MATNPSRWTRASDVFHRAIALPETDRLPFIARECGDDMALRAEVESLVHADRDGTLIGHGSALSAGTRLGAYEIVGFIAAGGMGEVYRARDTRLKREVAIKILPESFASDPDRLARFQREAEILATLNHPNIAGIYGLQDTDGTHALVMEFVEGETLADRIARGPIALDEALPIAKQIAEALGAAHEQGVIHRDLKPANIKVRPDGTVKVLDFGLAKALEPLTAASVNASASPTVTSPAMMTGNGMLLGTAAYMSPEQARGRAADRRSDIWAFGVVLYEMLTGRRAFDGGHVTDTIVAVLSQEPDWSALPGNVPSLIRSLLRHCLAKDRRKRTGDISTALFALDEHDVDVSFTTTPHTPWWGHVGPSVTAALLIASLVVMAIWFVTRSEDAPPVRVSRFTLGLPGTAAPVSVSSVGQDRDLAITPDGSRVVYVGNNGTQLFVRRLDALEPVAVFTGAPRGPFVSPDGQWIGFEEHSVIKKIALTGGPAVTLAAVDGIAPRGATWAPDDGIIFANSNGATGLQRVGTGGGPPTILTRPDSGQGEADHFWPELLPGGRAVLFTITVLRGGLDAAQIAVLDLQTGTRKILLRGGSHAQYVPTGRGSRNPGERETGHLVYAAAGTLLAVPFDLGTLEVRGAPVPVVSTVVTKPFGGVDAVVAGDGTLAYISGTAAGGDGQRELVWVDRQGHETSIAAPARAYTYPRLSPDGTRVAVYTTDQEFDIWMWNFGRATLTRATFDPGQDAYPVWTPDSRRLIFSTDGNGARNLVWQAADGSGSIDRLTENRGFATGLSPDGSRIIFTQNATQSAADVMQLELRGSGFGRVTPLVRSSFTEQNGVVSGDGRWLAYEANDSGRFEIYVRPYPDVNNGRWQVSTSGGTRPLWGRGNQELVYVSPAGALMHVDVERGASWAATTPSTLIKEGYFTLPDGNGRTYDMSPDGERFLMIRQANGREQTGTPAHIIVVQHWFDELRRLVPKK